MRLIPIMAVLSGRSAAAGVVGFVAIAILAWPDFGPNLQGPLDGLDRRLIPAGLRPPDPPPELVAVLGQVRGPVIEELCSVAISADGRWIVVGTRGGAVRLLEVPALSLRWQRRAHARHVSALDIAPDGRSIISGGADGIIRRWSIDGEQLPGAPINEDSWPVLSIAHSPDGCIVATGSVGLVRLWNIASAGLTRAGATAIPNCPVQAMAYSPDGRWLACGGGGLDHSIRLFRMDPGGPDLQAVLPGPDEFQLRALAFGRRGTDLAWLDTDGRGTVREGRGTLSSWRLSCPPCHGAVFARDGRHVLTVHGGGRVYVWRLQRAWPEP